MTRFSVVESPSVFRSMVFLAAPVMAEESLTLAVGWTDWWLTGHFLEGDSPKAAMSLIAYMMWLIPSLFASIAIGATAMVARFVGAGDVKFANHCANQAVVLGILLAVIVTALNFFFHQDFVALMKMPGDAPAYANSYLYVITFVIPLIMIEQVGAAALRGAGDTVTGFAAKVVVNIVNIFVSTVLITGWWIFPDLGFVGLAIGTAAGHAVGGIIILSVLLFGRAGLKVRFREMSPDRSVIWRLMRVGLPAGADIMLLLACQFAFIRIVYQLGVTSAAAHGLAIQVEALAYLPGTAFQVAAATMSGQFLGANDNQRAIRSVMICCASCLLVMTSAALVFYFFGEQLSALFTSPAERQTAVLSGELLKIVAFAIPSLAFVMVISGTLRGAGDTGWALLFTIIGFILIRIPLALVFTQSELSFGSATFEFGFAYGVYGAWMAMVFDLIIRSILMLARLVHGGWMKIKV